MSVDFATLQGLTIPEGEVTKIADAAGNELWNANPVQYCTITYYKIDNNEYSDGTGPVTKDGSEYYLRVTVNGAVLPNLGDSMDSNGQSPVRTISVPKGSEIYFQLINTGEKDRGAVYLNDNKVAGNSEYCYYTTTITGDATITFTWEGEQSFENWTYLTQSYWIARIYM